MGKHVAVLMGGISAERPVSLASGEACAEALESLGHRVTRIDVDRDVAARLAETGPDIAFNALHGPFGEDGRIQGVLEYLAIPYTHSGVLASALAMHKERAKAVVAARGVGVAEARTLHRREVVKAHALPPPYVVKPVAEGSSFGVVIVGADQKHPPQSVGADDWPYGDEVMVEAFVAGRELTCAVIDGRALEVCEITTGAHSFYDYESKYAAGGSSHIVPAKLPDEVAERIKAWSLAAHEAIGCRGVTRSDFRYDDTKGEGGPLCWLEVNTQPGMTATSLVPDIARSAGISFPDLVGWMVEDASCAR